MDKAIRDMANEMSDSDMLVKMSGGVDLVAIEGKYHRSCLTNYRNRNRYRAFLRAQSVTSQSSISSEQAKARAFAEQVMYIESAIEEGTRAFKLAELHTAYESSLINLSANRTRLKVELLEHFQEWGIQEQTDGKNIVLFFPEGMHSLLKNITLPSQLNSEALKLAAVAKLVRSEIFQGDESFKFDGNFPLDCQNDSVPYNLNLLIS